MVTETEVVNVNASSEGDGPACGWANVRTGSLERNRFGPLAHGNRVTHPYPRFNSLKDGLRSTETCPETTWQMYEGPIHTVRARRHPRRMDTPCPARFSPTFPIPQRGTYPTIPRCPRRASWPRLGSTSLKRLFSFSPFTHWAISSSASAGCWSDLLSFSGGGEPQEGSTAAWTELSLSLSKRREVSSRVWRPLICHHG